MTDRNETLLNERPVTKDDYRVSDATAFGCTFLAALSYAALCALALRLDSIAGFVVLSFPLAFVLQFFFNALHYCTHDTFVRSRTLNYVLGVAFGCITILNFALYKPYHMQHHRYLFTDRDPEPTHRRIESKPQYLLEMLAPLFFIDNWVQSLKTMVRLGIPNIFGRSPPHLTDADRSMVAWINCILLVWIGLAVWLTVIVGAAAIWLYWVPLYLSFVLANLVILPEHYETDCVSGRNGVNSRTIKTGFVTRFFIVGLNYHAEHHLYPGVPFHNLPEVSKRLAEEVKHTHSSYLLFHWSLMKSLPWRLRPTA